MTAFVFYTFTIWTSVFLWTVMLALLSYDLFYVDRKDTDEYLFKPRVIWTKFMITDTYVSFEYFYI